MSERGPEPNPYAAPRVEIDAGGAAPGGGSGPASPHVALFTPGHVMLATFLGTPLGGAAVLALNERRLGRSSAVTTTLFVGVVATALLLTLSFLLPDDLPVGQFLGLGVLLATGQIARHRQGALVNAHLAAGGKKASGWAAAGIGLAILLVVFVPIVFLVLLAGDAVR